MNRFLLVMLGLLAAVGAIVLTIAFTRPLHWPVNVRPTDWRRSLGVAAEPASGEEAVE